MGTEKHWLLGTAVGGALLAALIGSCTNAAESELVDPCSVYAGQCGTPCTTTSDCPSGMYCNSSDQCFADCTPGGGQCTGGDVCDEYGQCGAGLLPPGTGGATGCGDVVVNFEPQTPSIILLVDQSGSMTDSFGGEPRWDVVYDVLMDPNGGVVESLQDVVRFGLVLYTYEEGAATCPQLTEVTPPALDNYDAINAVYSQAQPEDNTPTGESLQPVATALAAFDEPGQKLIILATDGEPDTCAEPNPQNGQPEAIAAAQYAYGLGIQTVIIAVGDEVGQSHQQDMANAGAGLPVPADDPCNNPAVCAPTYEPATKQDMIDTFTNIVNGARTCVFSLDGEVRDGRECDGVVTISGDTIPCNDPDGYRLNSPTIIEFLGDSCDRIMNDPDPQIEASFPCDAIEPPN
ncbi:MAG: VWA domain-containing protein [Deltaproteobacteria bacterium]|jgi:hypothetical protein|nr:VWA domain-containing protein [Deltaproteobacteria bacterium]MBW2532895.1 VWA domain-containing protein [Deltaproteobacteria bacterium]